MKKNRKIQIGIKSLYLLLIVLAAVMLFLINVVAAALAEKYPLKMDLTVDKVFELKQETRNYIQMLKEPVTIKVLATEERFSDTSIYNAQASEIMKEFAEKSDAVTIEYIDYVRNPGFTASYPDLLIKHGDIIVESNKRYKLIKTEELFTYETNAAGELAITSSQAEQAVARAVLSVTSEEIPKALVLTGHEEETVPAFVSLLEYNNFEVTSGQLSTQDIDTAVDLVVITAPKSDFSVEEIGKLEQFLMNDGNYGKTLFYCADATQPELPVLESFLREWGVGIGDGMVFETDQNRVYQYQPFYGIVDYVNVEYAEGIKNKEASVLMPVSRPLEQLFKHQERYQTDVLLQFGSGSGVRPSDASDDFQAEQASVKGPIPSMILCTYQQKSHILVSGSVRMLDDLAVSTETFANSAYLIQVLNDLCEKDNGIVISPKSLAGTALNISQQKADTLGNLFVFVIPFLVLAAGFGTWIFRRHK